jgi:hypothetical protein
MKSAKLRTWTDLPELTAGGKDGAQGDGRPKTRDISRLIVMAVLPAIALAIVALMRPTGGDEANARSEGIAVRADRALSPVTATETEGAVGSELALAVRVSGPRGAPVQNNLVSWRLVGGGGGVLAEDSVLTNENGEALNNLRLPEEPGRVMVVVKAAMAEPPQVGFFIDVVVPQPRRIRTALGGGQNAPAGTPLPEPLTVQVTDAKGLAVPDIAVRFHVASGDGTLDPEVVFTDATGEASTQWTLGPVAGAQKVTAHVQAAGDTVFEFVANALESTTLESLVTAESATPAESVASPEDAAPPEPVTTPEQPASPVEDLVPTPRPRRLGTALGDRQSATVGEALPEPLEVLVTDDNGVGVPDVAVNFQVTSGGGTLAQRMVFTDLDGRATTRWTLGPASGTQQVTARVQAAGDTVFDFRASAVEVVALPEPATPAEPVVPAEPEAATESEATVSPVEVTMPPVRRLGAALGDGQRAPAGAELPEPLEVSVTDGDGVAIADVAVLFRVTSGGGRLGRRVVFTDSKGRASTRWTLGPEVGPQEVTARVQAAGDTAFDFRATALRVPAPPQPAPTRAPVEATAPPVRRVGTAGGSGQSAPAGALLPEPLQVRVTDRQGVAVPDVAVRFEVASGGGTLGREVVFTDSLGKAATRWILGPIEGPQQVTARIQAAGDTVLDFRANALEPVAPPESAVGATIEEPNEHPQDEKNGINTNEPETVQAEPTSDPDSSSTSAAGQPTESSSRAARPEPPVPARPETPQPTARRTVTTSLPVVRSIHTVGGEHICVLTGGAPSCRGANERGQLAGEAASGLFALVAGVTHTCAIDEAGAATCWGANDHGQLGDGSTTDRFVARTVQGGLRFASLAAGASHTCGLSRSGEVFCWGSNINGQLGDGSRDDRHQPRPVASTVEFRSVVAGWNHTCALTAKGEVYCWGLNGEGQIGDGTRLDRLAPARVPGGFSSLVAGASHTCGVSGGRVLCWGDNSFGQLGDGTTEDHTRPVAVAGSLEGVIRLAAGAMHTCALLEGGAVYCWGQNRRGELGDGTTENRNAPTRVATDVTFRSIDAGGAVTCGFSSDWSEYCWGQNRSGQLGDGTRTSRPTPTRSPGG